MAKTSPQRASEVAGRGGRARRLATLVLSLAASMALLPMPAARADGVVQNQVFEFTGHPQVFVTPEGVTELTVEAWGAAATYGGNGGYTKATVPVLPSEPLYVYVGGQGGPNGEGGWNGGGGGGGNFGETSCGLVPCINVLPSRAGAGGGASDVRQGGVLTLDETLLVDHRVVVAGGGGAGGHGGGPYGGDGGDAGWVSCIYGATGGSGGYSGGTFSSGGDGTWYSCGTTEFCGSDGGNGTAFQGGNGGGSYDGGYGGGGGGGGFGAGGGGGGGGGDGCGIEYGGGGGGGAGYVATNPLLGGPGAQLIDWANGVQSGNGRVIISWTAPLNLLPSVPSLVAPAANHVFGGTDPQVFRIEATDADDAWYAGEIQVRENGVLVSEFGTTLAASGEEAVGAPQPRLGAGQYEWRARACDPRRAGHCGDWSAYRALSVRAAPRDSDNQQLATVTQVLPSAGHVFAATDAIQFTIQAQDPESEPYTARVKLSGPNGAEPDVFMSPAASGEQSQGVVAKPLVPGVYTWSAEACDVGSGACVNTGSRSFTVSGATGSVLGRPNAPTLLSPSDGNVFAAAALQTFTIRVDDPNDPSDRNVGRIEIVPAGESFDTSLNRRILFTGVQTHGGTASATAQPPLPAGSYQWRASTIDAPTASGSGSGEFGALSEVRTFSVALVNPPPGSATPTAPADGHTVGRNESRTVVFSATATDAQGDPWVAEFEITKSGSAARLVESAPTPSGGEASTPVTLEPGSYSWRVRPRQVLDGAVGAWSAARTLTVQADGAPTVSLSTPVSGHQYLHSASQVLTASATDPEGDQVQLRFQVLNASGSVVVQHLTGWVASGSSQSYTVSPKRGVGSYTWRVEAHSLNSAWTMSETRSFTVLANRAASVPSQDSPSAGYTFPHNAAQVFSATATDPDGDTWVAEFEVRNSAGLTVAFSSPAAPSGAQASASPQVALPAGDYEWRVRATGAGGSPASAYSGWRTISVAPAPPNQAPNAPEFVSPSHGYAFSAGEEQRFTVRVSDDDGDALYADVEIERWDGSSWQYATELRTLPVPSGSDATAALTPVEALGSGSYRWRAHARDEMGSGTYGDWTSGPAAGQYREFTVA